MRLWNRLSPSAQRWTGVFAAWTVFGIVNYSVTYFRFRGALPLYQEFLLEMLFWYTLALGTPFVFSLAERYPLERPLRISRVLFHFLAAGIYILVYGTVRWLFDFVHPLKIMGSQAGLSAGANYLIVLGRSVTIVAFDYWALLGIGHALNFYRKLRVQEKTAAELLLRASQLESQLARAQLQTLRMQLNPHFLFNTLHSIAALVRENEKQSAIRMIAGLGDLLRQTLDHAGAQEVLLQEELDFLNKYLEIEQLRFQDRLRVQIQVHPDAYCARIPYLILQPLVENAIRHGISNSPTASLIEIRAEVERDRVYLQVRDDGPGLVIGQRKRNGEGIGVKNIQARLQAVYGDDHQFSLKSAAEGGTVATIVIPYHPARTEEADLVLCGEEE